MDISSRFSLVDFLAYLFPGISATLAIFAILLFTPLKIVIFQLKLDLSSAILFFVISYIVGVILSGFIEILLRIKIGNKRKNLIFIPDYQTELLIAFNNVFCRGEKFEEKWSTAKFYLCRSMIAEFMPNAADYVNRQSSLRQLRVNLIPSVVLWLIAGIAWGINLLTAQSLVSGILIILISIVLSGCIVFTLMNRMQNNEDREVREVQTAFLAAYSAGKFDKAINGQMEKHAQP